MAGKEHHHVWRLLQRGFGEKRGSDYHVWIYRKNQSPRQRGTGNFGVDKYFYGAENSETDKAITDFENSVQEDIHNARKQHNGYALDETFAAPLIAHLEVRSKFLRSELSNLTERMVAALDQHFSSPQKLQAMMKTYLKNHPDKYVDLFDQNLVPHNQRSQAANLIDTYIDNLPPHMIRSLFDRDVGGLLTTMRQLPDMVKSSHNEGILSLTPDSPRIRALRNFKYYVYRPANGQLILPDTCCAFIGMKSVSPFSQPKDDVITIIAPISSNVAIVGQKEESEPLELKRVNRLLASCAYEAFIASMESEQFSSLAHRIGKYAKLMTDNEIKQMFSIEQFLRSTDD